MTKQQVIDRIRQYNRSAEREFLVWFDQGQLESYLLRLSRISGCRGPSSIWVREGDTPAVVASTS
jgi:hypothetical protein